MVDDNFLVDLDRARGIAEGLVRENAHFKWSIQATTNLTSRLSLEDLKLLRRAGLHQICQGVDSGSHDGAEGDAQGLAGFRIYL